VVRAEHLLDPRKDVAFRVAAGSSRGSEIGDHAARRALIGDGVEPRAAVESIAARTGEELVVAAVAVENVAVVLRASVDIISSGAVHRDLSDACIDDVRRDPSHASLIEPGHRQPAIGHLGDGGLKLR